MAPAISRLSDVKESKIRRILPLLARHHSMIALEMRHFLLPERNETVLGVLKRSSFEFFCSRIEYLIRHNEIHYFVGVPTNVFTQLLEIVRHSERTSFSKTIRLAIFLKFSKEGLTQNALSREIGLSQPTISRIIGRVIDDLVQVAPQYIKFPKSRSEVSTMQHGFFHKKDSFGNERKMPCFGILDGKHWHCQHPPHSGSLNRNYKGFFSFNSLFVCDSDFRIIYIQISELGVHSDAQLYNGGPLESLLKQASVAGGLRTLPHSNVVMPPFILADNGFALQKVVMQPFRANKLTSENIVFNDKISGTRVKIENLFGILTSKFQIFDKKLKLDPATSRSLIVALSVVHNITIGPLDLLTDEEDLPIIIDPYMNAEQQRSALKKFLLQS